MNVYKKYIFNIFNLISYLICLSFALAAVAFNFMTN